MNVGDDVVLHVEKDEKYGYFEFYHDRKHICSIHIRLSVTISVDCILEYKNRTSAVVVNAEPDRIEFNITVSKAERADNGSYKVQELFGTGDSKCFLVYILGKLYHTYC